MKRFLQLILFSLLTTAVFSQAYVQPNSTYGFTWNRGYFPIALHAPSGDTVLNTNKTSSGAFKYRTTGGDSTLYVWDSTYNKWVSAGGGGGGSDGNNYTNSLSFGTGTGILTLGRVGLGNLTTDFDGRYLRLSDTATLGLQNLQSVTDVGNVTTHPIYARDYNTWDSTAGVFGSFKVQDGTINLTSNIATSHAVTWRNFNYSLNYNIQNLSNHRDRLIADIGGTEVISIDGQTANTVGAVSLSGIYQPTGNYLTALTGDGTASGPGSAALTLATVNSNVGTFGSASKTVTTTVNAKGLTTAISEQNIAITESQVTNLVTDLAAKQPNISLTTTGSGAATFVGNVLNIPTPSAGGVSSVSNSDGTLTISPTTGAAVASIALGHANTWTANQNFTTTVSTGTGSSAGMNILANSLTTGNGIDVSSSSITTGNLFKLTSTSTGGNSFSLANINSSGANGTSSKTATGQTISVTNTGTTSTNVGLNVTASGATNNYALITAGGNVGFGTSTPDASAILDLTSSSQALLLPRIAANASVTSPIAGDMIYNSTEGAPTYYNGSLWSSLAPVLLKYGNNLNNVRSWNGGSVNASANLVGSSGTTITAYDSVNVAVVGFEAGNDLTSGYKNFFWGTYAGRKTSTGYANMGIGNRTTGGNAAATAFTGHGNIGIGMHEANLAGPLGVLQTGNYNTVVGSNYVTTSVVSAGGALTTGSNNSFFGASAGRGATTGGSNSFFGAGAGSGTATVSNNTAVGFNALAAGTSASNTAVGASAALNLSSGTVSALGLSAGSAISTGTGIAIGISAVSTGSSGGVQGYTGADNIGIGDNAMRVINGISSNTSIAHARNTIVGQQSVGVGVTTAITDNVTLGYKAGADNAGGSGSAVTGSQNIAIGSVATWPSLSGNGQFVLGSGNNTVNRWMISDLTGGSSTRRWAMSGGTADLTATTASAALDIQSTTGGLLIPKMTNTQMQAISSPATGLQIYSTTDNAVMVFDGTNWAGFRYNGSKFQGGFVVAGGGATIAWSDLN